jgi:hypothetical protein
MTKVPILPDENSKELNEALQIEKNNLRKFFAGLTATTFGVIVALHPSGFNNNFSGWFYIVCVILNALSAILLIGSLFGRYMNLREKGHNLSNEISSVFGAQNEEPKHDKFAKQFHIYAIVGIFSYIFSIVSACVYLILDMCGK